MNLRACFENLKGSNMFFVESDELKPDLSLYVQQVAHPELLTIFPFMPRVRQIIKYDAGIVHLTSKTIEAKPDLSIDRIIDASQVSLPLIVLVSLIADPENKTMNRLHKYGVEAYPNNDTSSFISAMSRLNLALSGSTGK